MFFYTSLEAVENLEWLLNNDTTKHVTVSPSNLQHKMKYGGFDKLIVGNGQGLAIQNIGSLIIPTPQKNIQL